MISENNKVALITGGARGIGKSIVLNMARNNYDIIINYNQSHEAANELAKEVNNISDSKVKVIQADVSEELEVQKMFLEISNEFSGVDVLINNAGITKDGLSMRMKTEDWDSVINTNLRGSYLCSQNAKLVSVCTDGHRLAKYSSQINYGNDLSIIIPRKAILEINRILASFTDNKDHITEFNVSNNSFQIKINEYLLTSKLIEGNYPNFNKVIPEVTKYKITVDKTSFKGSLNIISKVVNQQYKGVKLTPTASALHLITSNTESEIGEDEIEATYDGEDMSIGFNISYIQDVIDTLQSESVEICINDQNSGCILSGPSDPNSVYVIMPMRV